MFFATTSFIKPSVRRTNTATRQQVKTKLSFSPSSKKALRGVILSETRTRNSSVDNRTREQHTSSQIFEDPLLQQLPEEDQYKVPAPAPPSTIDFSNTENAYRPKKTRELAFNYAILTSCSLPYILTLEPIVMGLFKKVGLQSIPYWFIKRTFFKQFTAGEIAADTLKETRVLDNIGIKAMITYSVEEEGSTGSVDGIVKTYERDIEVCSKEPSIPFMALKITGLIENDTFLRKMNKILVHASENPDFEVSWIGLLGSVIGRGKPGMFEQYLKNIISEGKHKKDTAVPGAASPYNEPLTEDELNQLATLMTRMDLICTKAYDNSLPVMIDAEQSFYQKAIDFITISLCKRYNREKPIVYNTYQQYLKEGKKKLISHIETAEKEGYCLGIKLVRGAYLFSESALAKEEGRENPIHDTIEATHECYNSSVPYILDRAKATNGRIAVLISGHNENSVKYAVEYMAEKGIPFNSPYVGFAQLYGMCDHVTFTLAQMGVTAIKCIPYGPIECVFPYLMRRIAENRGTLTNAIKERHLLAKEIKRRLFSHMPFIGNSSE